METAKLKKFAQHARRSLMTQVATRLQAVLAPESPAQRESPAALKKLEQEITASSKQQVIERVAYTWFNRFCALRFMDVNRYTRTGTVSAAEGQTQPELLMEAKLGHIDEQLLGDSSDDQQKRKLITDLLSGKAPSRGPQAEAYRLLLVAACNHWHRAMPFLFQRINDYTELLMPDDLLSENSILAYTREAMTPEACADVEVIGWLYQFYIAEKKDEVFESLKKNKKITPENIPAATQLFTPHWIVRYLVENSLGRLWMLNHPGSKLVEQMDYYIKPAPAADGKEQTETDFLRISKPEEIKICDPACGSGHMLTYAFDLLYAIYEEEGFEAAEIPEKILTHNLFGIEIDERAGELAAFALTMKACSRQRRFFSKGVKPNICVLENVHFDEGELKNYMDFIGRELFTAPLQTTLRQFEEADNFGSLIRPDLTNVGSILNILESKNVSGQLFISMTHQKALQALQQAGYLSPKYHVVIANPPYMGAKGMNGRLAAWVKEDYPSSKSDLFAMFIERNLDLTQKHGVSAMITMQSWMFLSSFEALRARLLEENTLLSMAHLGARAFDSIGGEVVSTTAFVWENANRLDYKGGYLRLISGNSEAEKDDAILEALSKPDCGWFYRATAADFKKIPGSPIAYWVGNGILSAFERATMLGDLAEVKHGLSTGKNAEVVRLWSEVSYKDFGPRFGSRDEALTSRNKWFPYNKGGDFRKWFGNCEYVLRYDDYGNQLMASFSGHRHDGKSHYFLEGVTWTFISSSKFAARYTPPGFVFDVSGSSLFLDKPKEITGYLCSNLCYTILKALNPTLNFQVGNLKSLPILKKEIRERDSDLRRVSHSAIEHSKVDWDFFETSWDFSILPIINPDYRKPTLNTTYQSLHAYWWEMTMKMQQLEEENNRIFIKAYGLQDELTPKVPLNEITLTSNPHYRYGGNKSEEELEALLLADTMREFISYAVGCMFGRYALEKPGLILANQGEILEDYLKQIPEPSFPADDDNVIPLLDGNWFTDDITERFHTFLRLTFGDEHFADNLRFIETALGKDIRKFFLKDFYNDHLKRYKKRPIYWMFSSPKGSFNALIYMHRYRPDTVSVVLNGYLREFRTKLASHKSQLEAINISVSSSAGEKTKALKDIEKINKVIAELEEYEREILYPLATQQIAIDLDDGVKVNYPKFGAALKPIPGLKASDD